MFVFGRPMIQY